MAVADFFRPTVQGAGPSQLSAMAPLLLGALGPVGGAIGVLGALYQKGRQEKAGYQAYQDELGSVGPMAQAGEGALVDLASRMAARGMQPPKILEDRIAALTAEREAGANYARQLALQQLGDQAAMQRVEKTGAQSMEELERRATLDAQGDERAYGYARRLEAYKDQLDDDGADDSFGTIPTGMRRVQTDTGETRYVPVPGGPEWAKRMEPIKKVQNALGKVQDLMTEIEETGGDMFGSRAAKQKVLMQQIVGVLGELGGSGVVESGEAQRYISALGDPTGWISGWRSKNAMLAPLQQIEKTLLTAQGREYSGLTGEMIPPLSGLVEAKERRKREAAAAAGLRPGG